MTDSDQEIVRAFRRQAQLVRKALVGLSSEKEDTPELRMVDGYIEIDRWLERYRRLCVPVRRTFLDHDKASFRQSSTILMRHGDPALRSRAQEASADSTWGSLDSGVACLARPSRSKSGSPAAQMSSHSGSRAGRGAGWESESGRRALTGVLSGALAGTERGC